MSESRGEIPKKIDRYEIIEAVGFGAMGAVYKAFDPLIKRPVAVKTLRLDVPPQSPDYKAFLERFATEARTAGRLSHPNIITLYDVGHTEDQVPWLAMEFVEGQTVAELLEGERLRPEVVVGLVSQIAAAVDYAHTEGVIHRDIKPSNVIVFGGEKVKVTDFGIAKLMDAEMTNSGLMMGTPSYMSPEQAMGEDLDGRTDIFSLGVVAFEMLSGQQPFPGNNVTSILYKLVHSDPVHPDGLEILGLLPDKWHQVFSRVLSKDPLERFPTAAMFVEQLEHCLGSWFGALEGETIIVKDPANFLEKAPSATDTKKPTSPVTGTLVPAADAQSSASDETVNLPSAAANRDEALEGATATFAGASVPEVDGTKTIASVPLPAITGEETVYVAEEAEETLYAGAQLDETLIAVDVAEPASLDKEISGGMSPRRPPFDQKKLALAGGAVLVALVVLLAVFLAGGSGEKQSDPVIPPEPAPVDVVESGSLFITSGPEGATVVVDGEERGTTPLELGELPFAAYDLLVRHEGFQSEELTAELSIDAPVATLEVTLQPEPPKPPPPARVRVVSNPAGAQVEIDGRAVGVTPTDRLQVQAGERKLRIVRDGFLPWEDTVRARPGRTVEVEAVLTERVGEVASTPEAPTEPQAPRVEVGELVERGTAGVVDPECIQCPAVRYPERARRDGLEGVVELSFIVDETGAVTDIRVQESAGEIFDEAVTDVVGRWRWDPATKYDVPVKIRWVQRFRFRQGR